MKYRIDKSDGAGEKLKNLDNGKGEIFTDPNDIGIYMLVGDLDRRAQVKAVYREENGNLWVSYDTQADDPHTWYFPVVAVKPRKRQRVSQIPVLGVDFLGTGGDYAKLDVDRLGFGVKSIWGRPSKAIAVLDQVYVAFGGSDIDAELTYWYPIETYTE